MKLSSQRWLRLVFLATAVVFVGVAVYVYAFHFSARLHPDDTVMALLAEKSLHAKSPVVADWYYANGDIWVLGPQLIALAPVAILGLGPASLLVSLLLGFALQLVVLVRSYLRLGGEMWIALFAAMATSMAWSRWHVDYVYVQLAYGFVTWLYVLVFTMFAAVAESAESARARGWRLALTGLLIALIGVQNPTRALVYVVAPVLVVCAWPWHGFPVRRRLAIAAAATVGWVVSYVFYGWVLARLVAFSIPTGHTAFAVGGLVEIKANLALIGRGLVFLCAGGESGVRALPGALLVAGALALVVREVLGARTLTALRFVCVIVLVQLGGVLLPLIVGNLLTDKESVRYVMPSLLAMLGLAVVIAVRAASDVSRLWTRRFAIG